MIKSYLYTLCFVAVFIPALSGAADARKLYLTNCSSCHGTDGEGGKGPALNKQGLLATASHEYFEKTIYFGRFNGCPSRKDFPAEDAKAIAIFIKSWQKVESLRVSSHTVKPENTKKGEEVFPICVGCHDVGGVGAMGPSLIDPGFQASASDEFLRAAIKFGRRGTPMKGYAKGEGGLPELTDQDVDDMIAYIRFLSQKRD